jgi:hypothetical protein
MSDSPIRVGLGDRTVEPPASAWLNADRYAAIVRQERTTEEQPNIGLQPTTAERRRRG